MTYVKKEISHPMIPTLPNSSLIKQDAGRSGVLKVDRSKQETTTGSAIVIKYCQYYLFKCATSN
jgi:hypothetical protein